MKVISRSDIPCDAMNESPLFPAGLHEMTVDPSLEPTIENPLMLSKLEYAVDGSSYCPSLRIIIVGSSNDKSWRVCEYSKASRNVVKVLLQAVVLSTSPKLVLSSLTQIVTADVHDGIMLMVILITITNDDSKVETIVT